MSISEYKEEDYLMLSGIQHFLFCRRQWALIHLEQQWEENNLTTDGKIFHERVHNPDTRTYRNNVLTIRGMRISSRTLGISGACDAVEFVQSAEGITLPGREGFWSVIPIEYKRGRYDVENASSTQLCAEAMCLEEMLCCSIEKGYLYWGEIRRRQEVIFTEGLRNTVTSCFAEMHDYAKRGYTPKTKQKKGCSRCSLRDICLPETSKNKSVRSYISERLGEL